ncbi:MAG: hypothetical protein V2I33_22895 [Kangiellaceae bacterium]|nr:hypothetical protein [Kangiellaceae bacterium]
MIIYAVVLGVFMYFKATEEIFGVWISQAGNERLGMFSNILLSDYDDEIQALFDYVPETYNITIPPPDKDDFSDLDEYLSAYAAYFNHIDSTTQTIVQRPERIELKHMDMVYSAGLQAISVSGDVKVHQ